MISYPQGEWCMVKMRDVAKIANVSVATVSRVLHNPETVKEATRNK